jgi:flagellar biogenesis protein FliO
MASAGRHVAYVLAWSIAVAATSWAQAPGETASTPHSPSEPASSQEDLPLGQASGPGNSQPRDGGGVGWLPRTLGALVIVLGLIFALRFILQKAAGGQVGGGSGGLVQVLGRSPIGFKSYILFLRIHQRVIVASQTPQGIQTLVVLDDPQEVAWIARQAEGRGGFSSVLERVQEQQGSGEDQAAIGQVQQRVAGVLARIRSMHGQKGGDL